MSAGLKIIVLAALLLVVGILGGCGGSSGPVTYSLPPSNAAMPQPESSLAGVLLVDGLGADSVLGGRELAWRDASVPNEIARYSRHLWNEAPTRLVQGRMVACLRSAGVATAVIFPYERSDARWVLTGELQRFEQVVGPGEASSAVVELDLSLSSRSRRDLIWQRRFRSEAKAADISPGAAVQAFSIALDGLCTPLVEALGRVN